MKLRTICLFINVGVKVAKNNESYLDCIKGTIISALNKLEPGDAVVLANKDGYDAYNQQGQWISAIQSYQSQKYFFPNQLKELLNLIETEGMQCIVFTDKIDQVMLHPLKKLFDKYNCIKIFCFGVGTFFHPQVYYLNDPDEINIYFT